MRMPYPRPQNGKRRGRFVIEPPGVMGVPRTPTRGDSICIRALGRGRLGESPCVSKRMSMLVCGGEISQAIESFGNLSERSFPPPWRGREPRRRRREQNAPRVGLQARRTAFRYEAERHDPLFRKIETDGRGQPADREVARLNKRPQEFGREPKAGTFNRSVSPATWRISTPS